jgi:hypothetical protein
MKQYKSEVKAATEQQTRDNDNSSSVIWLSDSAQNAGAEDRVNDRTTGCNHKIALTAGLRWFVPVPWKRLQKPESGSSRFVDVPVPTRYIQIAVDLC